MLSAADALIGFGMVSRAFSTSVSITVILSELDNPLRNAHNSAIVVIAGWDLQIESRSQISE